MHSSIARAVGPAPILAALALVTALPSTARASHYRFEVIADSVENGFGLGSFTCANINNNGDVAFKTTLNTGFDAIFRRDSNGTLTTIAIAEATTQSPFVFFGNATSLNDSGAVAFGANLVAQAFTNAVLVGDGGAILTIAQTGTTPQPGVTFLFPWFDISINDSGEVAFQAQFHPPGGPLFTGLFSGSGDAVTTHYIQSADVILDGQTASFFGFPGRPSINDSGDIAFHEFLTNSTTEGVFVGQNERFKTILSSPRSQPFLDFGDPSLNDDGTAAFAVSFFDSNSNFVTAIVKSDGGPPTTVADTTGKYNSLGAPSINNNGDVVFFATVNDKKGGVSGVFTGPNPHADKVIAAGDKLDGAIVADVGVLLCDRAINDSGQVAFIANLNDPNTPFGLGRSVVIRATPKS
jgi:hypothetical protein